MKNRLLVAVICIPALILVFFFCPPWVLTLLMAALSAIGVHEVLSSTGMVQKRRIYVYAMIFAAIVPFWFYLEGSAFFGFLGIFALCCLLYAEALHSCGSMKINAMTGALFFALFIPITLSAFVRLRQHEMWLFHIFMPIVIAFTSDAGGLFAGMLFGKHKLAPEISPKKTVEGALGAIVFAVFFALLGGLLGQNLGGYSVNYLYLVVYGVAGSVISQFGDLCFSYIKREYSIKDFGKLLPGHGGVLDRFDSVIFCAPLYEFLIVLLPAVTQL